MNRLLPHLLFVALLWFGLGMAVDSHAEELPAFSVTVRDGVFSPARIDVPAGERIKLVLKNEGPGPLEFENDEMRVEKILGAGGTSFVVLPKLQPGKYEFIDEFNIGTGLLVITAH